MTLGIGCSGFVVVATGLGGIGPGQRGRSRSRPGVSSARLSRVLSALGSRGALELSLDLGPGEGLARRRRRRQPRPSARWARISETHAALHSTGRVATLASTPASCWSTRGEIPNATCTWLKAS